MVVTPGDVTCAANTCSAQKASYPKCQLCWENSQQIYNKGSTYRRSYPMKLLKECSRSRNFYVAQGQGIFYEHHSRPRKFTNLQIRLLQIHRVKSHLRLPWQAQTKQVPQAPTAGRPVLRPWGTHTLTPYCPLGGWGLTFP